MSWECWFRKVRRPLNSPTDRNRLATATLDSCQRSSPCRPLTADTNSQQCAVLGSRDAVIHTVTSVSEARFVDASKSRKIRVFKYLHDGMP